MICDPDKRLFTKCTFAILFAFFIHFIGDVITCSYILMELSLNFVFKYYRKFLHDTNPYIISLNNILQSVIVKN